MIWLGIESSCDETACAILRDDPLEILSNPLYSQIQEHAKYGGVVPEVAARAHLEKITTICQKAIDEAKISLKDIDAIAFTRGPGLMGPLLVGASFARGLARDLNIPAYGINHLEGHLSAAWLTEQDLEPPYLTLTVSGGHTELVVEEPGFKYTLLGRTRDDAAGEAFDKSGILIGLQYPAGSTISKLAKGKNRKFHNFPRAQRRIFLQRTQDCCPPLRGIEFAGIYPGELGRHRRFPRRCDYRQPRGKDNLGFEKDRFQDFDRGRRRFCKRTSP